jgi:hypothetical protein
VIVVVIDAETAIAVDPAGDASTLAFDLATIDRPVVTVAELFELSSELLGGTGLFADVFAEAGATFGDGGGLFPGLGSGSGPGGTGIFDPGAFDPDDLDQVVEDVLGGVVPADTQVPGDGLAGASIEPVDLAYAVRSIDGVRYIVAAPSTVSRGASIGSEPCCGGRSRSPWWSRLSSRGCSPDARCARSGPSRPRRRASAAARSTSASRFRRPATRSRPWLRR